MFPGRAQKEELQVREHILPCCLLNDTKEPQALVNFFQAIILLYYVCMHTDSHQNTEKCCLTVTLKYSI